MNRPTPAPLPDLVGTPPPSAAPRSAVPLARLALALALGGVVIPFVFAVTLTGIHLWRYNHLLPYLLQGIGTLLGFICEVAAIVCGARSSSFFISRVAIGIAIGILLLGGSMTLFAFITPR